MSSLYMKKINNNLLKKFAFYREQAKEGIDPDVGQKRLWLRSIEEMERITGQGQSNCFDLMKLLLLVLNKLTCKYAQL